MKLLVSTLSAIYLVDTHTREHGIVHNSGYGYYGISWTKDGQELALSTASVIGNTLEAYMESEKGSLLVGERRGVDCLAAPHQILCADEHFIVTNTERNCLTIVRIEDLFYKHVWIDGVRWNRKGPDRLTGQHFNSVYLAGDRLYVLAHNHHRGSRVAVLSWPDLEVEKWVETKAFQAHNIWALENGDLITCNTMDGSLLEARTGTTLWKSAVPTLMTRGLACAKGYLFIGMSKLARREDRHTTDGGVWILDRNSCRELDFIPLPGVGNVREVRVIDAPDECHHGQPLLRVPPALGPMIAPQRAKGPLHLADTTGDWFKQYGTVQIDDSILQFGADASLMTCDLRPLVDVSISTNLSDFGGPVHVAKRSLVTRIQNWWTKGAFTAPHSAQFAGLVVRYTGAGDMNMIVGQLEYTGGTLTCAIYDNVAGNWTKKGEALLTEMPHRLRLEAISNEVTFWVNDQVALRTPTDVLGQGLAGVRGLGSARYSDFCVENLSRAGIREVLYPAPRVPHAKAA